MNEAVAEWLGKLDEYAGVDVERGDEVFVFHGPDPRINFDRVITFGGVVDGRPNKPGAAIYSITSDGFEDYMPIVCADEARVVLKILARAFPEIFFENAEPVKTAVHELNVAKRRVVAALCLVRYMAAKGPPDAALTKLEEILRG